MIRFWLWASVLAVPLLALHSYASYTILFTGSAVLYLIAEANRIDRYVGRFIVVSTPFLWALGLGALRFRTEAGLVLVLTITAGFLATCVGILSGPRAEPERVVRAVTWMLLLLAGAGTVEFLALDDEAVFSSRYTAGQVAILGTYVLCSNRIPLTALRMFAGAGALASVALTGARMASLVLLLAFGFAALRSLRGRGALPTILATALVALASFGAVGGAIRDRFSTGWEGDSYAYGPLRVYTSGRALVWDLVWQDISISPILGHGAGRSIDVVENSGTGLGQPLNDYLRMLDDFGILGAATFAIILAWLVSQLRKPGADTTGGAAIILACVTLAFTENVLIYSLWLIPAGILVGYSLHRESAPVEVGPIVDAAYQAKHEAPDKEDPPEDTDIAETRFQYTPPAHVDS